MSIVRITIIEIFSALHFWPFVHSVSNVRMFILKKDDSFKLVFKMTFYHFIRNSNQNNSQNMAQYVSETNFVMEEISILISSTSHVSIQLSKLTQISDSKILERRKKKKRVTHHGSNWPSILRSCISSFQKQSPQNICKAKTYEIFWEMNP